MDHTTLPLEVPVADCQAERVLELCLPQGQEQLTSVASLHPLEAQTSIDDVNPDRSTSSCVQENSTRGLKRCQPDCLCSMIPIVADHHTTSRLDVEEIYQVLGRDILRSSLLEDIDLYLECDEDSVYAVPIKSTQNVPESANGSLSKPNSTIDSTERHRCPQCDRTFTRDNLARNHRMKVHGEKNLFACSLCPYQGRSSRHLKKHLARSQRCREKKSGIVKLLSQQTGQFPALLETHGAAHSEVGDIFCNQGQTKPNVKPTVITNIFGNSNTAVRGFQQAELALLKSSDQEVVIRPQNGIFQTIPVPGTDCYIVTQVADEEPSPENGPPFGNEAYAKSQMYSTPKGKDMRKGSFSCNFCPYTCKASHLLKKHQSAIHNPDREVHCCDKCGCTFKQKRSLESHMKIHSGQFDFQCNICEKKFASSDHLRLHGRTHIQTRSFQCIHLGCGQAFRTSGQLRQHERMVHANPVISCPATGCEKTFTMRHLAAAHYKVHTGAFRCLQASCGRTFRDTHNLRVHQKTHRHNTTGQ